jgi:pyruvate-formate lyase
LSVSAFVKRVCTGFPVPSRVDQAAIRDLLRINADIARLGGLLKMAVSSGADPARANNLIREIALRQSELKAAAAQMANKGAA